MPASVPPRRRRRPLLRGALWALVLLGAGAVLGALAIVAVRPQLASRVVRTAQGYAAVAEARAVSALPAPPAPIPCVPAVGAGRPGEILALEAVPADARASVLLAWRSGTAATREREAASAAARAGGGEAVPLDGTQPALVVTAPGRTVRAARAAAPGASAQLAVGGTRQLCLAPPARR